MILPNNKIPLFHLFRIDKSYNDATFDKVESCLEHIDNIYNTELTASPVCDKSVDQAGSITITVPRFDEKQGGNFNEGGYPSFIPNERWLEIVKNQLTGKHNYFVTTVTGRNTETINEYAQPSDFQHVYNGRTNRYKESEGGIVPDATAEVNYAGFVPDFHGWLTKITTSEDNMTWTFEFTDLYKVIESHHTIDFSTTPVAYDEKHISKNTFTFTNTSTSSVEGAIISMVRSSLNPNAPKNGYSLVNPLSIEDDLIGTDPSTWGWDSVRHKTMDKVFGLACSCTGRIPAHEVEIVKPWTDNALGANALTTLTGFLQAQEVNYAFDVLLVKINDGDGSTIKGRYFMRPDIINARGFRETTLPLFNTAITYDLHGNYYNMASVNDSNDVNDVEGTAPEGVTDATWGSGRVALTPNMARATSLDPYPIVIQQSGTVDHTDIKYDFDANEIMRAQATGTLKKYIYNKVKLAMAPSVDDVTPYNKMLIGDHIDVTIPELGLKQTYQITDATLEYSADTFEGAWTYGGALLEGTISEG